MGKRIWIATAIVFLLTFASPLAFADTGREDSHGPGRFFSSEKALRGGAISPVYTRAALTRPENQSMNNAVSTAKIDFVLQRREVSQGDLVEVALLISEATDLYAVQVDVHFDPDILAVVDADLKQNGIQIEPGDFPNPALGYLMNNLANNATGDIRYAVTLLHPAPPVSGSGILATITFQALQPGRAIVAFRSVTMSQPGAIPIQPIIGKDAEIHVLASSYPYEVYMPVVLRNYIAPR